MVHDGANWRMKARRAALPLIAAVLPIAALGGSAVQAQSIMRTPNLNISSRIPSINTVRIDPNIAGRTTPNLRTSPACSYAYRDSSGECQDRPVVSTSGASGGNGGSSGKGKNNGVGRNTIQSVLNLPAVT